MPLAYRAQKKINDFNFGLSYRTYDKDLSMRDCLNVFTNQGVLETRHGYSKYNTTALGASVDSISFFEKSDNTKYRIVKAGAILYLLASTGASTQLKTGLTAGIRHRGITFNDRHIISVGSDGLFSYDGTTFTQLGQDVPGAFSAAVAAGGSLTGSNNYKVAITFYASGIGFESNYTESSTVTTTGSDKTIALTSIPSSADNAFIDKVRIYLKDETGGGDYLYISEISLGTTTYNITSESTSTSTPPTTNAAPFSGGGKYLTEFNRRLVYGGSNTYPNDIFFSETELPDAWNDTSTAKTINIPGNGDVTGIGRGLFSDSNLDPYLVIFKRKSTYLYSEVGGNTRFVEISNQIGCVSGDTVKEIDGNVYFLSESGWRVVNNGIIADDSKARRSTLANGDIDNIFKSSGYIYEINRNYLTNFQSVYYSTQNQYITLVAEGGNNALTKAYVYEMDINKFKAYGFAITPTAMAMGEDASSNEAVLLGDSSGFVYTHSIAEDRTDTTADDTSTKIAAYFLLNWHPQDGDFDATYNFRELKVRAITGNDVTVKAWVDFDQSQIYSYTYSFPDPSSGFILDTSQLDVDVFGDERAVVHSRGDINLCGLVLLLGFYQEVTNSNMNLLSLQLDMSKNGNDNR